MIKRTVHPQKILKKYVMFRTVAKNSTIIIITKYTSYHRYREIIQINQIRRREGGNSKALTSHRRSLEWRGL